MAPHQQSAARVLGVLGVTAVLSVIVLAAVFFTGGGAPDAPLPVAPGGGGAAPNVRADRVLPAIDPRPVSDPVTDDDQRTAAGGTEPGEEPRPFRGRVVDSAGLGVPGVMLRLQQSAEADVGVENAQALSEADGEFGVPLPRGVPRDATRLDRPLFLAVAKAGYVTAAHPVEELDFQEFPVRALPVVTGRVLEPDGAAVSSRGKAGVWIRATAGGERTEHSADLDAAGGFRLEGLPVGRLESAWAKVKGFPEHAVDLERARELAPDGVETLDLALVSGAVVEGVVVDKLTKEPVPGALVWADSREYDSESLDPTTEADAQGRYRLAGVAPRRHVLDDGRTLAVCFLLARAEGYIEAPSRAFAAPWNEEQRYEFEIEIEPSGSLLSGVVLLPDGETPAQGADVHLIDGLGNWRFSRTNREGRFDFDDLALGDVSLMARKGELGAPGGGLAAFADYSLAAGSLPDCRLVLVAPTGSIEGKVADPAGRPVAGAKLEARLRFHGGSLSLGIDSAYAHTEGDGTYRFEALSHGRYQIRPQLDGDAACSAPRSRNVTLAEGETVSGVDFVAAPCMSVSGTVAAGERDFAALKVLLVDEATGAQADDARPESDGTFTIGPVPASLYALKLVAGGEVLAETPVGPGDVTGVRLVQ